MKVYNHDIASLVLRMRRFKNELFYSVSSNLSEFGNADKIRLNSYIESIKKFKKFVITQPELDLPESSPKEINLPAALELPEIENLDIATILALFDVAEVELVNCQSARKPSGLTSHDALRFDTIVKKIELFLAEFVADENLDLPESSPTAPMVGAGNVGV